MKYYKIIQRYIKQNIFKLSNSLLSNI